MQIGLHTFHLHEICGLSANSTTLTQATAPLPTAQLDTHTYPLAVPPTTATAENEQPSKCLLCLSSPREVVLLPCRECAVNMIEFGTGGTIVHKESETNVPGTEGGAATEGTADATPAAKREGACGPSSACSYCASSAAEEEGQGLVLPCLLSTCASNLPQLTALPNVLLL